MENIEKYDDLKLYDISDFINKFKVVYELDLGEIEDLFSNYNILEWSKIEKYLINNGYDDREVSDKYNSYNFYMKALNNLSFKGNDFIGILRYLLDSKKFLEYNELYESLLESVDIYHYSSILKGIDINKFSLVMYHLINSFNFYLDKINSFDTYLGYGVDKFALIYGGDRIIPNRNLVEDMEDYNINLYDKTSLYTKKKIRAKKGS